MTDPVDLSIIIVSFNTRETTRESLSYIVQYAPDASFEVILVDNASTDGSADMAEHDFPWVRLIRLQKNKGFAGGNNEGIRKASGRYLLLLNSDAFIGEGVLYSTFDFMEKNPSIGVLGCSLTNPDGSLQASARMLPCLLNKFLVLSGLTSRFPKSRFFGRVDFSWWDHSCPRKVGWVVGAYFLIRRKVVEDVGLLDERYFLYSEEIDFCRTAQKAGWDVVFYPYARVVHLGGLSAACSGEQVSPHGRQLTAQRIKSEFRYYRKWHGPVWVMASALMELSWRLMIVLKNLPSRSQKAQFKKRESLMVSRLIVETLLTDRFGKGID